jgi:class 3 adenylate cyclase
MLAKFPDTIPPDSGKSGEASTSGDHIMPETATDVPTDQPPGRCGKCGYLVHPQAGFICSECGADLRQVGIVTGNARRKRRIPRIVKIACIAVIWGILCAVVTVNLFLWIAPYVWPAHLSSRTSNQLVPLAGKYQDIVIARNLNGRVFGDQPAGPPPPGMTVVEESLRDHAASWTYDVTATLHGLDGGATVLHIDPLHDMSWRRTGTGGEVPGKGPLDQAAVIDWLKTAVRHRSDEKATTQDTIENEQWAGYEVAELMGIFDQLRVGIDEGQGFYDLSGDIVAKVVATWPTETGKGLPPGRVPAFNSYGQSPVIRTASGDPPLVFPILLAAVVWAAGMWFWNRLARRSSVAAALAAPTGITGTSLRVEMEPGAATPRTAREVSHRLLTILFSDVKDYTTQSANRRRGGVLDIVRRHRDRVFPIVKKHHGRVVKQMGDAILATFDSATDAVLAGLEIQQTSAAGAQPDALQLRIAISTGEVTVEADDVFGTAVNVASRVQQLAGPGEVYFTEPTRVMLNDHEVRQIEVGSFELKGVSQPVKVFRALPA